MMWKVYSVFDVKVGAYAAPFLLRSHGEAIRSFETACSDDKLPFKAHPRDYRLFYLGQFDDNSGVFSPDNEPLIMASEFRVPELQNGNGGMFEERAT